MWILAHEKELKEAIKVTVALSVGSLFVLLEPLHARFPHGVWVSATIGFVVTSSTGASFATTLNRLIGSTLGSIAGSFIVEIAGGSFYAAWSMMLVWVTLAAFFRGSVQFGYAALVSAFTAPIIIYGIEDIADQRAGWERGRSRTEMTTIGLLIFVFMENAAWPQMGRVAVRGLVGTSILDAKACFVGVLRAFGRVYAKRGSDKAGSADMLLYSAHTSLGRAQAALRKQPVLVNLSLSEPELWRLPFPHEQYVRMMRVQESLQTLLFAFREATAELIRIEAPTKALLLYEAPAEELEVDEGGECSWAVMTDIEHEALAEMLDVVATSVDDALQVHQVGSNDLERARVRTGLLKIEKAAQSFDEFWQGWYASFVEKRQSDLDSAPLPTPTTTQIISLLGVAFSVHQILAQTIRLGWAQRELLEHERPRTYY
jgi:hypothetical protein